MNPIIALMIKQSGRPWWQARYITGKVLSEWDTLTDKIRLPFGQGITSRWEEVSKEGMVGLRLLCPNGMAAELEAPVGHHFFQFKCGGVNVPIGFTGYLGKMTRFCDAYIIGVVLDSEGNCYCRAWETKEKRLIQFRDNIYNMKYRNIGALNLDVQGIRV